MEEIVKKLGFNRVKINEPLASHVNLKVGGPADMYYEAKSAEELAEAVKITKETKSPFVVIGNGANILVSDKGFRGLVIQNHSKGLKFLPHGFIEVESGLDLAVLINEARSRNLIGTERMLRVPGTVGGAVYMNAGDTGKKRFFGDLIISVEIVDSEGNIKKLQKEECEFAYRSSRFQKSGEIVLKAKLQLNESTKEEIEKEARDILVRKINHPAGATVGSTFKNPVGDHAGELIEKCGLKGKQIGGAKISEKHANFIINEGNAKAADVKELIYLMKNSVKEKFSIDLEEEVRYIGDWDQRS